MGITIFKNFHLVRYIHFGIITKFLTVYQIPPQRKFFYLMFIGVGILGHISYSLVSYLHVSFSGLITLVGEQRANFSATVSL